MDEPEAHTKVVEAFDDHGLIGCPWGAKVPAFILICEEEGHLKPGVAEHYGSQILHRWILGWQLWGYAMKLPH
ncbi:hypothetical protein [Faecalicatena faecalis]|uniref:hypothetical protein n=1 Tax=Faecalicatena faecalis TaxID=2726362 RepID=UPI001FE8D970|nr:hypothetical protein [Faecalicatena faecalis]